MGNQAYQRQQAYKLRHKKQGLCISCSRLAVDGLTRCPLHHWHILYSYKRWYSTAEGWLKTKNTREVRKQRLREEGKCVSCGIPLIEGEGLRCINCSMVNQRRYV